MEIVKGRGSLSEDFSDLLILSAPTLFATVFGEGFKEIIQKIFKERRNLFSFEHTYFLKMDGKIAGMVLSYDWTIKRREEINTGRALFKHMGLKLIKRLPLLLKLNSVVGILNRGEYYISNIAVYPEYRGMGIGTTLLNFIEETKSKNIKNLTLDVETKNEGAIRLYKRLGFIISGKLSTKLKEETFEFFRMEKIKAK